MKENAEISAYMSLTCKMCIYGMVLVVIGAFLHPSTSLCELRPITNGYFWDLPLVALSANITKIFY